MIKNKGFSLIEVLVSVGIISIVVLLLSSFILGLNFTSSKTKADREVLENARRVMDQITYEIKGATSLYSPTTSLSQLSLQTNRYLPTDEKTTFIDFFLCGSAICFKKESQSPIALTANTVSVSSLSFTKVVNGATTSVKIGVTVNSINPSGDLARTASTTLNSIVSLRNFELRNAF